MRENAAAEGFPVTEEWTVEGVARCPGDCGLYFDVEATLPELEKFIKAHKCAKENVRCTP
jgi:hypothetical protein